MSPDDGSRLDILSQALIDRHLGAMTTREFLRAARALSARYVEDRRQLPSRSPLDSAGKRAAFAVLYGPIHYATTRAVVDGLQLAETRVDRVVDLGCGTGTASAAWSAAFASPPVIDGIDRQGWAVGEANWTWRTLGLSGRARRADLVTEAGVVAAGRRTSLARTAVLAAWSANELAPAARDALLSHLVALGRLGATVVVLEPLSGRAAPWWDAWAAAFTTSGGRADTWRVPNTLPKALRRLDRDAGFDRPTLSARSLLLLGG